MKVYNPKFVCIKSNDANHFFFYINKHLFSESDNEVKFNKNNEKYVIPTLF